MLRRNIRLRKEYLYMKKIEEDKKEYVEKIKSIKESYEKNKQIKKELRNEENELRKKMDLYDEKGFNRSLDDEYFFCGIENPRVLITTSRNPSAKLENFVKELKLLIPNSEKINRGSYYIKDIMDFARKNKLTDLIIIHEYKGEPRNMIISHLPFGPTLFCNIKDCKMRHEFKEEVQNMNLCYPHLIFHNFHSDLAKRIMSIFKYLFPPVKMRTNKRRVKKNLTVPSLNPNNKNSIEGKKEEEEEEESEESEDELQISIKNNKFYNLQKFENNRVITFFNKNDMIYFRHYNWITDENNEIVLNEVGPRFSLMVYKINKESLDSMNEDYEYIYRPFLNSKKTLLT